MLALYMKSVGIIIKALNKTTKSVKNNQHSFYYH